jgi:hypothetical protein
MITPLVECNINSNDKLAIVDINLGYKKSSAVETTNSCPLLKFTLKSQDNMDDHY